MDGGSPRRDSRSPTAVNGKGVEAKKRRTMNSRDSEYEEQVKAAMEASRREMEGEDVPVEGVDDEPMVEGEEHVEEPGDDLVDTEEKEKLGERKNKGKRKREDDISSKSTH